ncbi:MAG TPA: amino acid ABC transporter substrate-binding protein [Acidimicrobiales bacterium]|nr:amino acid ABC transporter substrate-binding protein [Acidimicrobiales bacterium]
MLRGAHTRRLAALLAVAVIFAGACSDDDDGESEGARAPGQEGEGGDDSGGGGLLAEVQDRGTLRCGVNEAVPGFGLVDADGNYTGFDIEFCKVVAAAVLGDPEAVEYTSLGAEQRFTALAAGEVDVLIRNTTRTASRDGGDGARFLATTFYDGQGMMVKADSGFTRVEDMGGSTICVLQGTTTELNLATRFAEANLAYTPLTFTDANQIQAAFAAGQCDGWTSDLSQLAGVRSAFPADQGGPGSLVIFDEAFSKEPLGPAVRDGDDEWAAAVDWAVIATIQAEEFGITSANVEQRKSDTNLDVLRFLGQPIPDPDDPEADPEAFDPGLGLDPEFAATIIAEVGNYGEIYDRTVGPGTPLGLERGINAQWEDGGLLYAPPYR